MEKVANRVNRTLEKYPVNEESSVEEFGVNSKHFVKTFGVNDKGSERLRINIKA